MTSAVVTQVKADIVVVLVMTLMFGTYLLTHSAADSGYEMVGGCQDKVKVESHS
jgi:hypothetical protein